MASLTPEQYYAEHQKAFRCAFDFLNKHFPPGDLAWWEQASNDLKNAADGQNQLAHFLLIGVYDYLNEEWKRRNLGETENGTV